MVKKRENKTIFGVLGVILTLFGLIGTIPILINREYLAWLPLTGLSVVLGIIIIAYAVSD